MRLILLGAPGTGKGTQATLLKEKYGVPHISTGEMFREAIEAETEVGMRAKSYIDSGQLVPDEVVVDMVRDCLGQPNCAATGFIFDGFPRTVEQAERFNAILEERNESIDAVILLSVDEEQIVKRLSGRRLCQESGRIYNVELAPDEWEHSEDKKKGCTLVQRNDDKPEVVKARMRTYHNQTSPLVEYYRKHGMLVTVDGEGSVRQVFDRIVAAL